MMFFRNIPDGESVFLDSNVFVYAFAQASSECITLVERCKQGRVYGFVSTLGLAEVYHKTMTMEAAGLIGEKTVRAQYLEQHPDLVQRLTDYAPFLEHLIMRSNLGIIEVSEMDLLRSQQIRDRYGLLTIDSVHVRVALDYGIPTIATNDRAFERVEGIQVFRPGDIP